MDDDVVLVLEPNDAGDSATGEKYESPPRWEGEGIAPDGRCVWTLSGGGLPKPIGNRGGGALAIPANDWPLSPVVDRDRRLVLDAFLGNEEVGCP